jgi:hypothetical protein
LEWRGRSTRTSRLAQRGRPVDPQRSPRLGHGELHPSQSGASWLRRQMAGVAVVEREGLFEPCGR